MVDDISINVPFVKCFNCTKITSNTVKLQGVESTLSKADIIAMGQISQLNLTMREV